eukprot:297197-Prymnesium_polylepis.2
MASRASAQDSPDRPPSPAAGRWTRVHERVTSKVEVAIPSDANLQRGAHEAAAVSYLTVEQNHARTRLLQSALLRRKLERIICEPLCGAECQP